MLPFEFDELLLSGRSPNSKVGSGNASDASAGKTCPSSPQVGSSSDDVPHTMFSPLVPHTMLSPTSAVPHTMLSESAVPHTMLSQSAPPQSVPQTMLSSPASVPPTML